MAGVGLDCLGTLGCIHSAIRKDDMATKNKPLLIRLREDTRQLLDRAAEDQRRSRASLVDEILREHLEARYADVTSRLDHLLSQAR
jgi:hypothetical protein